MRPHAPAPLTGLQARCRSELPSLSGRLCRVICRRTPRRALRIRGDRVGPSMQRCAGPAAGAEHITPILLFVITVCEELSQRAAQMGVPESKIATVLNGCDSTIFYRRRPRPGTHFTRRAVRKRAGGVYGKPGQSEGPARPAASCRHAEQLGNAGGRDADRHGSDGRRGCAA